ncbi:MAG TPA: hypothetical protein VIY73_12495 [Polyangiaceae bacterium]
MSPRFALVLGLGLTSLAGCTAGCTAAPPASSTTASPAPTITTPAVRYLALGDSFTIGTGSSPEQAFFALMETQARDGLDARDGLHPSAEAHDAWAADIAWRGAGPCSH